MTDQKKTNLGPPPAMGEIVTIKCQAMGSIPGRPRCNGNTAVILARVQPSDRVLSPTLTASFRCCTCNGVFSISC